MSPDYFDKPQIDYLALTDQQLLAQCDTHIYKSSGPGGQHRNKVSSAVRLHHRPTGISAHGDDSRSQHENKALAVKRLRMNIACRLRRPVNLEQLRVPEVVAGVIFTPRGGGGPAHKRLQVGRRDERFWPVAGFLLDLLEASHGRLSQAAANLGISTSNLVSVFQDDHHLFAAASEIRKRFGEGPIK